MKINKIWMKDADNNLYIEKDGKLYRTNAAPYRIITESELEEITTPLTINFYIKANHLFEPSASMGHDLKVYGLEIK